MGFVREEQGSDAVAVADLSQVAADALPRKGRQQEGVSLPWSLGGISAWARFDL